MSRVLHKLRVEGVPQLLVGIFLVSAADKEAERLLQKPLQVFAAELLDLFLNIPAVNRAADNNPIAARDIRGSFLYKVDQFNLTGELFGELAGGLFGGPVLGGVGDKCFHCCVSCLYLTVRNRLFKHPAGFPTDFLHDLGFRCLTGPAGQKKQQITVDAVGQQSEDCLRMRGIDGALAHALLQELFTDPDDFRLKAFSAHGIFRRMEVDQKCQLIDVGVVQKIAAVSLGNGEQPGLGIC